MTRSAGAAVFVVPVPQILPIDEDASLIGRFVETRGEQANFSRRPRVVPASAGASSPAAS
jgi:hypothetical protein